MASFCRGIDISMLNFKDFEGRGWGMTKFRIILFVQKYKYLEIRFNDVVYCQNVAQLTKNEMSKLNFSSSFIPGVEI